MALSGSDQAYLDARAGVARAGASRVNYYRPINWHVVIDGTARTTFLLESLEIVDQINQQPNSCTLVVFGFTPTSGMTIDIGLGSADNLVFSGRVIEVETLVGARSFERVYYHLNCLDHTWELDKHLVIQEFPSQDAAETTKRIINTYGSGYTTLHVQDGLGTPAAMSFVFEPVSEALTRIANAVGGYWYCDYKKDIHLYITETLDGDTDEVSTSARFEWRQFKHRHDISQVRTRVYAEGGGTRLKTFRNGTQYAPVADDGTNGWYADAAKAPANDAYLLVDATIDGSGSADRWRVNGTLYTVSTTFDEAAMTNSGAAVAGATTLTLDDVSGFPAATVGYAVLVDGSQIIHYDSIDTSIPKIDGIPASGPGSIVADIPDGAEVTRIPTLTVGGFYVGAPHETGDEVKIVRIRNGSAAQTALGTLMGGGDDGVREAYVVDEKDGYLTAAARGDAEITLWGSPHEIVEYLTRDVNVKSGKAVTVNVGGVSDTFTVQTVTIRGIGPDGVLQGTNVFPWRQVTGGSQRYDFYDVLARVEQGRL